MRILDRLFGIPNVEKLKNQRNLDGLLKVLQHKRWEFRRDAAVALGELRYPDVATFLMTGLQDPVHEVRRAAATALGKVGDRLAVQALKKLVQDEEKLANTWAQEALGSALSRSAGVRQQFAEGVHKERGVRQAALNAIRQIETRSATPEQEVKLVSSPEALLATLSVETREMLAPLATRINSMVLTSAANAEAELEARNISRRQIWGDQAVSMPIRRGSAVEIVTALLECVVADYKTGNVSRVSVEEVPAPAPGESERVERANHQLADMSPALRARYEKRFIKHMRRTEHGSDQPSDNIRKISVTVYFQETFGRHEILRIDQNNYLFMPCTKR